MNWWLWGGLAVLLFWSVGAYNRLVRLRSAAGQAFGALEAQLRRHVELVQSSLPPSMNDSGMTQPGDLYDEVTEHWSGLRGAARQLMAAAQAAKAKPLHGETIGALGAAMDVLSMAWQRMHSQAHDLAGAAVPDTLQAQWTQLETQTRAAIEQFNEAVAGYNAGIAQFPALVLASLFRFEPAQPLRLA